MTMIEFPNPLKKLLEDSQLQPHIRDYANRVSEILADNKLPFFPDYTDHGVDHINQVLLSEVELVPKDVWTNCTKDSDPKLLNAEDAVVLIGATLLHDIAMHLRPQGFLELVSEASRFQPLPWFKDEQECHSSDRPWRELWMDFQREARRFSDRKLGNIVGLESVGEGWKFEKLPENTNNWDDNHKLIIGEFIRRHHARLAHEIAMYGFPGLDVGLNEGQFPALGEKGNPLRDWADLVGLAARSHGLSLRVCQAYITQSPIYSGELKPGKCAVLYPMALLRVADYLQIDRQRTPTALLKLRNPQSPISVQEWNKHFVVQRISASRKDPRAKIVTVSPDISLAVYLQVCDLLDGLQAEIDHSTVVLDEAYGLHRDEGLDKLNLAIRRVDSNLHSREFRDLLPYVPEHTCFSVDPNLLSLLVEPLYGNFPGVGIRELMQNSMDAVRALEAWCEEHNKTVNELNLRKLPEDADVLIEYIQKDDGSWLLRIQDRGIGMTHHTLQNYFLRAGASFRQSQEWTNNYIDEDGKSKVLKAGRFGIGVFANFLLGQSFTVETCHVSDKNGGYSFTAAADSQLIEISRCRKLPVGTVVYIPLAESAVERLQLDKEVLEEHQDGSYHALLDQLDWACWDWPKVVQRILQNSKVITIVPKYTFPLIKNKPNIEWSEIVSKDSDLFDKIFWTFGIEHRRLLCNGLVIGGPSDGFYFSWQGEDWKSGLDLSMPTVAVLDSTAALPLTIQRYGLTGEKLPFMETLERDILLSVIAHALICAPNTQFEALSLFKQHPLVNYHGYNFSMNKLYEEIFNLKSLRWMATSEAMVPVGAWFYSLLKVKGYFVYGYIATSKTPYSKFCTSVPENQRSPDFVAIGWNSKSSYSSLTFPKDFNGVRAIETMFDKLVESGIESLGAKVIGGQVMICTKHPDVLPFFDGFEIPEQQDQFKYKTITSFNCGVEFFLHSEEFLNEFEKINTTSTRLYDRNELFYYMAEVHTKPENYSPDTLLEKIWNECLESNPIPFDPAARRALIEKGRQHPELKSHIEKWEEMKRTGSKWVVGGDD
ncbi:MAG: ATP-binding protein [Methylovulum sp.]|nr:ATP-binding protein [Methylovulum sp.]